MTLIQKYNQLVKTEHKIRTKGKEQYRMEKEKFYSMVKKEYKVGIGRYELDIPKEKTFNGKPQTLFFYSLPWESIAYGVKHE